MKIITYNVNGIRSALSKGFTTWLSATKADIVCLQEVKALECDIDREIFEALGYHVYWMPAEKKGYSGVAILTKKKPEKVTYGCNLSLYDCEGRVLRADFESFSVVNVYMPSGSSGELRQSFKFKWLEDFQAYAENLRKEIPNLIISGDYNICHQPIDIHNPVSNKHSSGFLPEERQWMSNFIDRGFIDAFRYFNKEPHHYTWWSYRFNARARNMGWRIDYHLVTTSLKSRLRRALILREAFHSDHCPVVLELE